MSAKNFLKRFWAIALLVAVLSGMTAFAAEKPKVPRIGVVIPDLSNIFWDRYRQFMEDGAKELNIDLIVLNANNKPDNMIKGLEDLVAQGVDGIIFTPYWESATRGATLAKEAGIPFVLTDCFADFKPQSARFPNYIAFVGPYDEYGGYEMAKVLFKAMKPNANGKKIIGVINGTAGTTVAIGRRKGLQTALDENPDVVVAGEIDSNFLRDIALTKFESLYQGNPDIAGVWTANGESAVGAIAAIKRADKAPGKDVQVVSLNLDPENVELVKKGEQLFDLGGHWLQGGFGLVILYDYLNGHAIPADKANVLLKFLPLTKEQVPQFEKDFPGGMPVYDFKAHSKTYNPGAAFAAFDLEYSK